MIKILNYFDLNRLVVFFKSNFLFVIICILSRVVTSITYSEDIDSLRFALAIIDYNILELRPHFPGYPIFCFFSKIIYFFTNSIPITFSIIGGLSIFIIIKYSVGIWEILFKERSIFFQFLIFFNPFLWLMSNRYMSDLLGLAILIASVYYALLTLNSNKQRYSYIFFSLIGVLLGIRISFSPFLIPFIIFITYKSRVIDFFKNFIIMALTILLWLIPLFLITGFDNFIKVSMKHTSGHFFNWGGSVLTSDSSYLMRFIKLIESIFADGLGLWWFGRHWLTLIFLLCWIYFFIILIRHINMKKYIVRAEFILLLSAITTYIVWVYFFQNIVYKPRHVMPVIPFIIMLFSNGVMLANSKFSLMMRSVLLVLSVLVTCIINYQHQFPSAVSQLKEFVIDQKGSKKVVISSTLINNYIKQHKGANNILFVKNNNHKFLMNYYKKGCSIFTTRELDGKYNLIDSKSFYHNPYVNRLWPKINLYVYRIN